MSVENGVALDEVRSGLCLGERDAVEAVAHAFWMAHRWGPRISRFVGQLFDENIPRPLKEWEIGEDGNISYPSGLTGERFGRVLNCLGDGVQLAMDVLPSLARIRDRYPDRFSGRSVHEISRRLRVVSDHIKLAIVLFADDSVWPRGQDWRGPESFVRPHLNYFSRKRSELRNIAEELTASRDLFGEDDPANRDVQRSPVLVESETAPEADWLQPVPETNYGSLWIRAVDGTVTLVELSPEMSKAIELLDRERQQPSSEGWISVRLMRAMMHFRKAVDPTRSVRQDINLARRKIMQQCVQRVRGKRRLVQPASVE